MNVQIINLIIKSLKYVFEEVTGQNIQVFKPNLVNKLDIENFDIVTIVGFNGQINGNVVYSFSNELTLDVVTHMVGMEYTELDDLAMSAIGELGNMISGNIAGNFEKIDTSIDISPPSVIQGNNIKVNIEGTILEIKQKYNNTDFQVNVIIRNK